MGLEREDQVVVNEVIVRGGNWGVEDHHVKLLGVVVVFGRHRSDRS